MRCPWPGWSVRFQQQRTDTIQCCYCTRSTDPAAWPARDRFEFQTRRREEELRGPADSEDGKTKHYEVLLTVQAGKRNFFAGGGPDVDGAGTTAYVAFVSRKMIREVCDALSPPLFL